MHKFNERDKSPRNPDKYYFSRSCIFFMLRFEMKTLQIEEGVEN